jgi:hypothetical protein
MIGAKLSRNIIGAIAGGVIGFVLLILGCVYCMCRERKRDPAPIYMKEESTNELHDIHDDADQIPNFVGVAPALI